MLRAKRTDRPRIILSRKKTKTHTGLSARFRARIKRIPPIANGKKAFVGGTVKRFADALGGTGPEYVENALRAVNAFKTVKLGAEEMKKYYGKRTAARIIKSKTIYISEKSIDFNGKKFMVGGCLDKSDLIVALLRAKRIPAYHVRIGRHSFVIASVGTGRNAQFYKIDTIRFQGPGSPLNIYPLDKRKLETIEKVMSNHKSKMGIDSGSIGINCLEDAASFL